MSAQIFQFPGAGAKAPAAMVPGHTAAASARKIEIREHAPANPKKSLRDNWRKAMALYEFLSATRRLVWAGQIAAREAHKEAFQFTSGNLSQDMIAWDEACEKEARALAALLLTPAPGTVELKLKRTKLNKLHPRYTDSDINAEYYGASIEAMQAAIAADEKRLAENPRHKRGGRQ